MEGRCHFSTVEQARRVAIFLAGMRSPSQPYHRPPPGTQQCALEVLLTYDTCDGREGKTEMCRHQASLSNAESTYMYRCTWTPPPPLPNLVKLLPSIGRILTLPKLHLATYKTSSTIYCMVLFLYSILLFSILQKKVWKLMLVTSGVKQVRMSRSIVTTILT